MIDDATAVRRTLLEALSLKELPRAGWVREGVEAPESVAAHSWGWPGSRWSCVPICEGFFGVGFRLDDMLAPIASGGESSPSPGALRQSYSVGQGPRTKPPSVRR